MFKSSIKKELTKSINITNDHSAMKFINQLDQAAKLSVSLTNTKIETNRNSLQLSMAVKRKDEV